MERNSDMYLARRSGPRFLRLFIFTLLAVIAWWLLLSPVPFDPQPMSMAPNPAGEAPYISNSRLSAAELVTTGKGPEGVAFDPDGNLVTGLVDGRLVRVNSAGEIEELGNTEGRPLGLDYDAAGNLIIADAAKGLLKLAPDGRLTVLADSYEDKKLGFVDDLTIGKDGRIWFSDASQLFPYGNDSLELFTALPSGRLFVFDPRDNSLQLVLGDLAFSNGVALAQDESFVLVNETYQARVTRLWLTGDRAGQSDVLIENLPGFPDNITEAPNGDFWIALVAPRSGFTDRLMNSTFLRKVIWRIMQVFPSELAQPHVWAVRVSNTGEVVDVLDDPSEHLTMMTSVTERDGKLYLGSLIKPYVGVLALQN